MQIEHIFETFDSYYFENVLSNQLKPRKQTHTPTHTHILTGNRLSSQHKHNTQTLKQTHNPKLEKFSENEIKNFSIIILHLTFVFAVKPCSTHLMAY